MSCEHRILTENIPKNLHQNVTVAKKIIYNEPGWGRGSHVDSMTTDQGATIIELHSNSGSRFTEIYIDPTMRDVNGNVVVFLGTNEHSVKF